MKRLAGILMASVLLAARLAPAAPETVTYKSGEESVSGFLALPSGAGRHPALIVIHEWWGLNDWTRERAKKFAADGYVALAVDLYRGKSSDGDPDVAHQLMRGLPEDRAGRDLKAAFDYLAARSDVDPARIGSIGWCMGGGYSLAAALALPRLSACVIYYGRLVTDPVSIAKIHAPLLGNFAALDKGIPPDSVKEFEKQALAAGQSVDFKVFDGVGHAFASSKDPAVFNAAAARDADARADAFLAKNLKSK